MILINPSVPINLFTDETVGAGVAGETFALPAPPVMITWQVFFGTPPASITVQLQASNDGVTFSTIDQSTSVTDGNIRTTFTAATHIRARINAVAGGDTITVTISAKALSNPGLFEGASVVGAQSFPIGTDADVLEKTLYETVIEANTFISAHAVFTIRVAGITAANGNVKTATLKIGSASFTIFSGAVNNNDWIAEFIMTRRSPSIQVYSFNGQLGTTLITPIVASLALDERSDIAVSVTGQNGAAVANDVVLEQVIVTRQ